MSSPLSSVSLFGSMPSRPTSPRTSALNRVRERVKVVSSRFSSNPQSQDTSLMSTSSQNMEDEVSRDRDGSKHNTSIERKYQEEVIKIHGLWKQAKCELKEKDEELRELRREFERERRKLQEVHAAERAELMRELEHVKVAVTDREREFERREHSMRAAVRDLSQQVEKTEDVMQKALRQRDEQEAMASAATDEGARLKSELEDVKSQFHTRESRLQKVLTSLEEENRVLSSSVLSKSEELDACMRRLKQGDAENEESSKQIQRLMMMMRIDADVAVDTPVPAPAPAGWCCFCCAGAGAGDDGGSDHSDEVCHALLAQKVRPVQSASRGTARTRADVQEPHRSSRGRAHHVKYSNTHVQLPFSQLNTQPRSLRIFGESFGWLRTNSKTSKRGSEIRRCRWISRRSPPTLHPPSFSTPSRLSGSINLVYDATGNQTPQARQGTSSVPSFLSFLAFLLPNIFPLLPTSLLYFLV
eukprot:768417-Hanusia_phi.AAC.4